ncbi:hypothetical protein [Mongoliitalea daihaiensis]|uniref:hypothetical protein n=1 Tax=Mongoliitalea daihaiensis TaxID=2782006 RepID=UPI001F1D8462|nr:hypothetical protein [Mongoliitalea daihaiensis]UJP66254.1 hypothetical protein IPZ59_06440 [Mongoliitalea daihaiensis]
MKNPEQIAHIPLSFADKLFEIMGIVALVWLWLETVYFQQLGLEQVPDNFDFFEMPNEYWASKMTYAVPLVATIFYISISWFNYYNRDIDHLVAASSEKKRALIAVNRRLWRWVKLNVIIIFLMIEYFSFHTGSNFGSGVPNWMLLFFPFVLFSPLVYFFIEYSKSQLK